MALKASVFLTIASDVNTPGTPVNNSTSGDRITYRLQPGLSVNPAKTLLKPIRFNGWYTTPNISAGLGNNTFRYVATAPAPFPGTFTFVIPAGLYSVQDLTQYIATRTTANGHGTLTAPVFTITPIVAEGKVSITAQDNFQADILAQGAPDNGLSQLLGFTFGLVPAAAAGGVRTVVGAAVADFTQGLLSLVVNISIVRNGYVAGRSGNGAMELPLSEATPNRSFSVINQTGYGLEVNNSFIDEIQVWITDSSGRPRSFNGNLYTLVATLEPVP